MSDESVVEHLVELDDASRLLLRAAALIEERGWCRGRMYGDNMSVCLLGGISLAVDHVGCAYANTAGAFIRRSGILDPARWNDAPGRTKDDVIAKLRAVALGINS